jgi:hypothetical protein
VTPQEWSRHCHTRLPEPDGDKKWYLYVARAGLLIGVATAAEVSASTRSPVERLGQTGPRRNHFHPWRRAKGAGWLLSTVAWALVCCI